MVDASRITATSPDGSLLAISNRNDNRIRCYDSKTSLGSLKFTLIDRDQEHASSETTITSLTFIASSDYTPPNNSTASPKKSEKQDSLDGNGHTPPKYLVSCSFAGFTIWDLTRGAIAHRISSFPDGYALSAISSGYGSRNGNIYALLTPNNTISSSSGGKCIIYEYTADSGKLVRKIKAGKFSGDFGIHTNGNMASSADGKLISICVENSDTAKMINAQTGARVGKVVISENTGSNWGVFGFSSDSKFFIMSVASTVNIYSRMEAEAQDGKFTLEATCLTDSTPVNMDMRGDLLFCTCIDGSVSMFNIGGRKKTESTDPRKATLSIVNKDKSNKVDGVHVSFHSILGSSKILLAKGQKMGDVSFETLAYRNDKRKLKKEIVCGNKDEEGVGSKRKIGADGEEVESSKKNRHTTILGPAEGGSAALSAMDIQQQPTGNDKDVNETLEDADKDGVNGISIGERLQALSKELNDVDSDDDMNSNALTTHKHNAESTAVLLKQALQSSDNVQLEIALAQALTKTQNERQIEVTLGEMSNVEDVLMLLTKIVHRLAKRPARAQEMSIWIKCILTVHGGRLLRMDGNKDGNSGEEEAMEMGRMRLCRALGPLRNLLAERTEAFEHLLKLEGRMRLLSGSSMYQ